MAGMYPDNRTESIFGDAVTWPGVDGETGKFTNGDFSDPLKRPSFVPAETINLILDNLAELITSLGGEPNNFGVDQLKRAVGAGLAAAREHADDALGAEAEARRQGDADTLERAGQLVTDAQLATNTWLPSVQTVADLPAAPEPDAAKNYLCKVLADPDEGNNVVWQLAAGETEWAPFASITFIPPATETERGGARVPAVNGLRMDGDALKIDLATRENAGAMSADDLRRLDKTYSASEYTFVIDSDAALAAWADDAPGNDYSRILIKAGTWTLNAELTGGMLSNPSAAIDISDGRTLSIVGETGSKIIVNSHTASRVHAAGIKGMATGNYPNINAPEKGRFIRNVAIEMNVSTSVTGMLFFGSYPAFFACENLINCTGILNLVRTATGGGSQMFAMAFHLCVNLTACNGTAIFGEPAVVNAAFLECTNLTNCAGNGVSGFFNCAGLTGCVGLGSTIGFFHCMGLTFCVGTGEGSAGNGFRQCRTGFGNRNGPTPSPGGTFNNCLMAQGTVNPTTNDWDNTAAGGWNMP